MAGMRYVRPFDPGQTVDTGFPGYRAQFISHLESGLMIASHIAEGGRGPTLHYHRSDQMYYLLRGSMNVRLGEEVHKIGPGTLVFIPAGLPHCNWNEGPGTETHFEMIVPTPAPGAPLSFMVDSPGDVPAERRTTRAGYVRRADPAAFVEAMPGFVLQQLAEPASGPSIVVNYAEVGPGRAGPGTHVHEFDQYYLVMEGRLTVEVALQRHLVEPDTLVILPAGVPHRQYNEGQVTEKHLAVLAPAPEPGTVWDAGVEFSPNGQDHGPAAR